MYAIILIMDMCVTDSCAVYRVNWLRAKAQFNRWEEETKMVKNEMTWTTLWFENQRKRWQDRAEKCEEKQQRDMLAMPGNKWRCGKHSNWRQNQHLAQIWSFTDDNLQCYCS
jgi:hypothetical protein